MTSADFQNNAEKKRELLAQAKELQDSTQWKSTADKLKELMQKWKDAGYAGADNEPLWKEFQAAQQTFFDRQKKHYEELHEKQKVCREKKQKLIEETKTVIEESANGKTTHQKLEELFARWKKVGSAGRSEDERLWEEFRLLRSSFYEKLDAEREDREKMRTVKRQQKAALITEVNSYTKAHDYSDATLERVRTMIEDWKKIGTCGRDDDEKLWAKYRKAQDDYWFAKKFFSSRGDKADRS